MVDPSAFGTPRPEFKSQQPHSRTLVLSYCTVDSKVRKEKVDWVDRKKKEIYEI